MPKDDSENAPSLVENITKFFEDCFAMLDVNVYATHRVGNKRLEGTFCRAIVCRILGECKRAIILDSSRVTCVFQGYKFLYKKGSNTKRART